MKHGKKMIALVALVALVATGQVAGQHYSSLTNGYSGVATAEYLGTTAERSLEEWHRHNMSELKATNERVGGQKTWIREGPKKLNSEQSWLIWQALGEYDLRDGEVYDVIVFQGEIIRLLVATVSITNNGNSFKWYAVYTGAKQ